MDDLNSPTNDTAQPQLKQAKWIILGLLSLGFVTCIAITVGVWLAFDTIRNSIETTSQYIPLFADQPLTNHIAFVGNDNNMWLVSPDGENLRSITIDGMGYNFPTWAPDGRRLAFIGRHEVTRFSLFISPTSNNSEPIEVFNQPGASPFYLYWSPDSNSITFLTQERSGLAMRRIETRAPDEDQTLAEGSPFYWVWSPQSDKMLVHVGGSRAASDDAHISILENLEDAADRVELNLSPGRFQAPVWSSDGNFFYYIATNGDGQESIYKTDAATLEQQLITNLGGATNMVLSPDNRHIAYTQFERGLRPPFGRAYLVDTDGKNHKRIMDEPVASLYWSPNGKKLALLGISLSPDEPTASLGALASPLPQEISLRWWIYEVEEEMLEPLISFKPTATFLQTVPFYDQYHLSITFWSPDSRYFVVTKGKDNSENGTVWVADTTGQEEPQQIGEGTLAVWSWQ